MLTGWEQVRDIKSLTFPSFPVQNPASLSAESGNLPPGTVQGRSGRSSLIQSPIRPVSMRTIAMKNLRFKEHPEDLLSLPVKVLLRIQQMHATGLLLPSEVMDGVLLLHSILSACEILPALNSPS